MCPNIWLALHIHVLWSKSNQARTYYKHMTLAKPYYGHGKVRSTRTKVCLNRLQVCLHQDSSAIIICCQSMMVGSSQLRLIVLTELFKTCLSKVNHQSVYLEKCHKWLSVGNRHVRVHSLSKVTQVGLCCHYFMSYCAPSHIQNHSQFLINYYRV